MSQPLKTLTGTVKRVYSGDHVQLQGPVGKSGLPLEKDLYLIGISAPKCAYNSDESQIEEPFGYQARELLRKTVLGKKVDFYIETTAAGRELASFRLDEKDVANILLENGLAKVVLKFEGQNVTPKNLAEYQESENKAKTAKKGLFSSNEEIAKNKRIINRDIEKLNLKAGKYAAICEEFANGNFTFYLPEHSAFIKFHLEGLNLPIINYKHQQELRFFVEERVLQRDIALRISRVDSVARAVFGEIITEKVDLSRDLIEAGFAKLNSEAVTDLEIARFRVLKDGVEVAKEKQLRIWKDFKSTGKTTEKGNQDSWGGKVIEVHSGDSLSVQNLSNGVVKRLFLSNVRAPGVGNKKGEPEKVGAFDAKEFMRKLLIGKSVRVEIEFSKTLPVKLVDPAKPAEQARTLEFASLFLNDKNVSETLVSSGLATVAMPRVDEEFTKYLKQLKEVEDQARTAKKGLFGLQEKQIVKYNDLSFQKNAVKVKQFYSFNQNEKKSPAVVELVLSGSRYKIRLINQQTMVLFSLQGIRCLPNDSNVKAYQETSAKALAFSKENLLQRDVEVEFESVDNNGTICGTIILNKHNYALSLLETGLATVAKGGLKVISRYQDLYEKAEAEAKKNAVGIWQNGPNLTFSQSSQVHYKDLNSTQTLVCSEVANSDEFFLQDSSSKHFAHIEKELENFAEETEERLKPPIKSGTPCVALFLEDGRWYRARIEKHLKGDKWLVFFIDYGNYDEAVLDDLRKMPAKLLNIDTQAKSCSLAFLKTPKIDSPLGDSASEWLKSRIFNKKLEARFYYQIKDRFYVTLQETGNKNPLNTVNCEAITNGFAKIDQDLPLPNELNAWKIEEERISETGVGVWGLDEEEVEGENY